MRHRWIRTVGFGPALLAVVLAVAPVPAATARTVNDSQRGDLRVFLDRQAHWFDQSMEKALRATPEQKRWEVLVDVEKDGEWNPEGYFDEVFRHRPATSKALDPAVKNILDSLGTVILIGEVQSSRGNRLYVVAAVLEQDSSLPDSEGMPLKRFVPLHVNASYQDALRFAQAYEKFYDGSIGNGESPGPQHVVPDLPGDVAKPGQACVNKCANKRNASYANCGIQFTACSAAANAGLVACALGCGGLPPCEAACGVAYLLVLGLCTASYVGCQSTADQIYELCVDNCPEGPGCSATAIHTATSALPIDRGGAKIASAPVTFALSRAEKRGEQSFVLDEWAIVKNGLVQASSNPDFGLAVTDQGALPAGSYLMIQEPIHDKNSRHVEKPEVRISNTGLARSEKGRGEVVVARLEFSSAADVDRVEIVYTSRPMEKTRLEQLVSQRVGLVFESEKEHRTAVYVVLRLTDKIELLGSHTAFPKCCCGGEFCV